MKKTLLTAAPLAMALTLGFGSHIETEAMAGQLSAPTEEITIQGKKPARFNHATHNALGLSCGSCHHDAKHQPRTAEDIAAVDKADELKCMSCHNKEFPVKKLQKAKNVFHARCKDCHKKGVEGKKGPSKCTACHIKSKTKKVGKATEGC